MVRCGWTCCDAWSGQLIHKRVVARGRSQHEGRGGSSPLYPGTLLEAKGKKEEERGERRKKKREEEEGAPLGAGAGSTTGHAISGILMDGVLRGFKSMEVTSNLCFDDHCSL